MMEFESEDVIQKELDKYKDYQDDMKMSVCRFKFSTDAPPWEAYFRLARNIGYKIPNKWQHLYLKEEV